MSGRSRFAAPAAGAPPSPKTGTTAAADTQRTPTAAFQRVRDDESEPVDLGPQLMAWPW
jgi:hypothetical protein